MLQVLNISIILVCFGSQQKTIDFFVWIISEIWWTKSWSFSWTHLFLVKWTWVNDLHHPSHPDDLEQHSLGDCALHKCKSSLLRAKASNITIIIFSSCCSIITIIYCLSSSRWSPSSPLIILLWLVILNNLNILVICGRCKRCLWCRISIFSPFLFPGSQALCRAAATFWPWDIAHFSLPHPLPTTHPPKHPPPPFLLLITESFWNSFFLTLNCFQPFPSPSSSPVVWTKLENFKHISQLSMPDLLFQPPGSESNYAGFIFGGNFSKPGLARHQIKWKFVISFKYAKAFRICRSIQGPKYEQVMKFSA